ncbi:MAG: putative oxidoreductase ORF5 in fasciation locus [bacterium]|nr:putative oxidoreductase ORF5 in fasciation locus [bacterium]
MSSDSLAADLKALISGEVLDSEEELLAASEDFGRLIHRHPRVVVRPTSAAEVAKVLQYANKQDVPVATRGEAHSQTGQSLVEGGIVLSTRALAGEIILDEAAETVTTGAGTIWGEVVKAIDPRGWVPRVLTNNLNVSMGGTLSVAGLGVASFRYGTQGDNAEELQFVTGTGEIVECRAEDNREIYDLARSGLGQFGVITRAKVKVRKRQPQNRTYMLLYDNLEGVLADSKKMMSDGRFDFVESWCVPLPVGFKSDEGRKRVFGEWFYPLHVTKEFEPGKAPVESELLSGLQAYRKSHVEDRTSLEFAFRLEPLFELWKRGPYWGSTHPWMEAILPWETSTFYVKTVLEKLPPPMLGGGHILLWPCTGGTSHVPLFKRPAGEFVLGFGILPGIPKQLVEPVLEALDRASAGVMMVGGKRYLSGWIRFNREQWKQHWGDDWNRLGEAKRKHDPKRLLNPGFIDFE